jgi:acid stress-induced BolA-like protein IbaG/YrbA
MAIDAQKIEDLIRAGFPNAQIQVQGDDGAHFAAMVIDESFRGMNRVQQQRAVNATVKSAIDSGELHALALNTKAPE